VANQSAAFTLIRESTQGGADIRVLPADRARAASGALRLANGRKAALAGVEQAKAFNMWVGPVR
jgi:hypothetical protein